MNEPNHPADPNEPQQDEYSTSAKRRRFRFKSSKRSHSDRDKTDPSDRHSNRDRHRRHRSSRHHHSSKRQKPDPQPTPTEQYASHFDTETAFRESLFDALGDDEGAEYWESIYGQPIHTYSVPNIPKGPEGELEQMDEEEYAAYVRAKMWSRTREGMMEEEDRRRQEKAKQRKREEAMGQEYEERRKFERAMDESLRRGKERKKSRIWKKAWEDYVRAWEKVDGEAGAVKKDGVDGRLFRNMVFWPVESGKRRDVSQAAVEEFMRHAPTPSDGGDAPQDLMATLKAERVRWHPDKIQHRYGVLGIDDVVMGSVTEVFQIVDQMWNEAREKGG